MWQKYGQHFLHDQCVLDRIESAIDQFSPATVLEIWPGKGALTHRLLHKPYRLVLSEIDRGLQEILEKLTRDGGATIVRGDILQQEVKSDTKGTILFGWERFVADTTLVVGNLPYYITSPILRKFFFDLTILPGGVFLVQKEVAEKIAHDASKKSYLRWLLNMHYRVTIGSTVKASSFSPPPKVMSAVIILEKLASPRLENDQIGRLLAFLELTSPFKRKTLGKIQNMQAEKFAQAWFSLPDYVLPQRLEELWREEIQEIIRHSEWV